jgi:hypothetical protein
VEEQLGSTRFDDLIPGWVFVVSRAWQRAVLAVAVPWGLAIPLLVADRPPRSLYSPLLLLALIVVAGTCGWWAAAITGVVIVGLHWNYSLALSWTEMAGRERVSLVGMTLFAAGIVALVHQMERTVGAVRGLDEQRQRLLRNADHDRVQMDHVMRLSNALASARTVQAVADEVLRHLDLPRRPDASSVALVVGNHLRMIAAPGTRREVVELLELADLTASPWLEEVIGGQPVIVADRGAFAEQYPSAGVLQLYPSGSWAVLPFRGGGTVGLLSMYFVEPAPLDDYGLYLSLVAEVLANAMERAAAEDRQVVQMRELELAFAERDRIARTLSTALLPPTLPRLSGFEAEGWLIPAGGGEIAGDFYDLFPVGNGDWVAVLGDVCGKGAEAAAVTALARYAARATALHDPATAQISDVANTALTSDQSDLFCTMAIVHYSAVTEVIEVTLAGHHPVRLIRDGVVRHLGQAAPPLGYATGPAKSETTALLPGDVVVLFSDGLVERDPSYDCDELDATLREAGNATVVAERLRQQITSLPATRLDDAAVLVISRAPV